MTIHKDMYDGENKKTIMVSGGFDPVHAGHIRMIREAAQFGDVIIIANSDDWLFRKKGFVFMDSPGYDPASVTGQIASGCNLVTFTTGRGSAFGSKPAPCIKIATNTYLYERQKEDMDINAGEILTNNVSLEEKGREMYEKIIDIASGSKSKSEEQGLGDFEFVPWQIGATM